MQVTIDNKVRQVDSFILRKLCHSFRWNLNSFKRLWEKPCRFNNNFLVHCLLFLAFCLYFLSKTTAMAA